MLLAPTCVYAQSSAVASQSKVFLLPLIFTTGIQLYLLTADILPRKAWILTVYYTVLSQVYDM